VCSNCFLFVQVSKYLTHGSARQVKPLQDARSNEWPVRQRHDHFLVGPHYARASGISPGSKQDCHFKFNKHHQHSSSAPADLVVRNSFDSSAFHKLNAASKQSSRQRKFFSG
jgi:hypothetical protein